MDLLFDWVKPDILNTKVALKRYNRPTRWRDCTTHPSTPLQWAIYDLGYRETLRRECRCDNANENAYEISEDKKIIDRLKEAAIDLRRPIFVPVSVSITNYGMKLCQELHMKEGVKVELVNGE